MLLDFALVFQGEKREIVCECVYVCVCVRERERERESERL